MRPARIFKTRLDRQTVGRRVTRYRNAWRVFTGFTGLSASAVTPSLQLKLPLLFPPRQVPRGICLSPLQAKRAPKWRQ
jgi:hypothetical protein